MKRAAIVIPLLLGFGWGCAQIIDFDGPLQSSGSTSGGGSTTSTDASSTSGSTCVATTSCAAEGAECGMLFDGCQMVDCGSCTSGTDVCDAAKHRCTCASPATGTATLVADTIISPNTSWQCGAISAGGASCVNLHIENGGIRGLLRFSIDAGTAAALTKPGAVVSAKLTITPADVCESTPFTPSGKLDAFVMRNDWDESEARWCHRSGPQESTTIPWGMPGAADPVNDYGPLAGTVTLPTTNVPFTIDLDPAQIVASSKFVVNNEISFRLAVELPASLVIKTKEWSPPTPAQLSISYCP